MTSQRYAKLQIFARHGYDLDGEFLKWDRDLQNYLKDGGAQAYYIEQENCLVSAVGIKRTSWYMC